MSNARKTEKKKKKKNESSRISWGAELAVVLGLITWRGGIGAHNLEFADAGGVGLARGLAFAFLTST